jgi:hypothetical protein
MTTHDQIIAVCVLAIISVPLGTFIAIKTINKLSRPPVNTLTRSHGDIELGNYIEPDYSYYPDLLESPAPTYYTGQYPPSYFSGGNPPSFNTIDRINCPLEDYINLDYILLLVILLCFLIL